MKPIKLTMRAFGPYAAEQAIDFDQLNGRSFFLIHGPTGAGKTTILDGICFALFGKASGAARTSAPVLRSQFADADTPTHVTFDFALGPKIYRAFRSPPQEVRKKRGAGTRMAEGEATLWDRTDAAEEKILATGLKEVESEVGTLLGFNCDQFRQVVLLPQGEFQKLLMGNSQSRQTILESLFRAESYRRIEEGLKESARSLEEERKGIGLRRIEILQQAGAASLPELEERKRQAEKALYEARAGMEAVRGAAREASDRLVKGKQAAGVLADRDEAVASLRLLESRQADIAERQKRLARAEKAAGLADAEREARQRRIESDEAAKIAADRTADRVKCEKSKADADADLAAERSRDEQRTRARREEQSLAELAPKAAALNDALTELARTRSAFETRVGAHRKAIDDQKNLREKLAAAKQATADARQAAAMLDGLKLRFETARKTLENARKLAAKREELRAADIALKCATEAIPPAEQEVARQRQRKLDYEAGLLDSRAAFLAAELAEGKPCPVCGSTHHPSPARGAEGKFTPAGLKAQAEAVALAEKKLEDARAAARAAESRFNNARANVEALADTISGEAPAGSMADGSADSYLDSSTRSPDAQSQLVANLKKLESEKKDAEVAASRLEAAAARERELASAEESAANRLAAADSAVAEAKAAQSAAEARVIEREAGIPAHLRNPAALETAIQQARRHLAALETALKRATDLAESAGSALAAAIAAEKSAAENLERCRLVAEQSSSRLTERLAAAGFVDLADLEAAKLPPARVTQLATEIQEHDRNLKSAADRASRASKAAEGIVAPDLAALESAARSAGEMFENAVRSQEKLANEFQSLTQMAARLAEAEAELARLDARFAVVGQIANVASADNRYKLSFQRYVLGVFLDEVLLSASRRLKVMSKDRYLLQRAEDVEKGTRGNVLRGLDLQVYDEHSGEARPVATLSGGECFLASLALALGLADVVQAYAGGIRLETIFVDEGFGSLDPESLDLAIRALKDLQKGGRLVGIISHVTELTELIDARLEVTPTRAGSTARFVVG
jgi:exonuclease SbcC